MLTSLRKVTLQKEGYAARKEGTACPYEDRSDEWHHWQTGWLMHQYVDEETPADIRDNELFSSPPANDAGAAQEYICPECKTLIRVPPLAACPSRPPVQQLRRAANHA